MDFATITRKVNIRKKRRYYTHRFLCIGCQNTLYNSIKAEAFGVIFYFMLVKQVNEENPVKFKVKDVIFFYMF
jgi:hypothetical protein